MKVGWSTVFPFLNAPMTKWILMNRVLFTNLLRAAVLLVLAVTTAAPAWCEETDTWRWSGIKRVVAIGDVHGAYEPFVELLGAAGLVSPELRWIGGETHLVMLGDLVDRGPRSREVLDLLMRLQEDAVHSGGQVHVVLGNHEVMNLVGDVRYVSEEEYRAFASEEDPRDRAQAFTRLYGKKKRKDVDQQAVQDEFDRTFPPGYFGHRRAFSAEGTYGGWLLEQPILIVINGFVYVHGGLAPCLAEVDPEEINDRAINELLQLLAAKEVLVEERVLPPEARFSTQHALALKTVERYLLGPSPQMHPLFRAARAFVLLGEQALTLRTDGPLWYRGTSLGPEAEEQVVVTEILEHLDANKVMVGHTPTHTGRVSVRLDGRVVRADTGMLASHYNGRAAAVIQQNGLLLALYPGDVVQVLPSSTVEGPAETRVATVDLESVLREADVVSIEDVGTGTTRPTLVTMAHEGVLYRGIYKTNEVLDEIAVDGAGHAVTASFHRYEYEVAAYRIARLLGLDQVPATVQRRINGHVGSLQLWVENAVSESNRRDEDLQPPDATDFERQTDLVSVFDVLIHNVDRDLSNLLVTTDDWRLWMIDHAHAFALTTDRPPGLENEDLLLDAEIVERLRSLDVEVLQTELEGFLSEAQIEAVLARRDLIIEPWQEPELQQ